MTQSVKQLNSPTHISSADRAKQAIEQLRHILRPDQIVSDSSTLFTYESDGFTIAKSSPAAVVFAESTDEVVRIVRILDKLDVEVVPRGTGTGLTGGCVAFDHGVIVSTVRMKNILGIDLSNRVAHVEAGVRNMQLSDAVAQLGQDATNYHFAPDPVPTAPAPSVETPPPTPVGFTR